MHTLWETYNSEDLALLKIHMLRLVLPQHRKILEIVDNNNMDSFKKGIWVRRTV